jgi:tetratricopeptide (TPR) repeat protein
LKPKGVEFNNGNVRITKGMLWNINNMKDIANRNPWLAKIIQAAKDNNIAVLYMPTASKGKHTAKVKFVDIDEKTRAVVDNDNTLLSVEIKSGDKWKTDPDVTKAYKSEFALGFMNGIVPEWAIGHMKITGDDALTFENYVHGSDIALGANGFETILATQRTSNLFAGEQGQKVYDILQNHINYNIQKSSGKIKDIMLSSEIGARMMQGIGKLKPDFKVTAAEHKALGSFVQQALDYFERQIDADRTDDTIHTYGENAYVLYDRLSQMVDSRGNFLLNKLPLLITMNNILAGRTLTEGNNSLGATLMRYAVEDMIKGRVPVMASKIMPDFNAESAVIYTINKIAQDRLDEAMNKDIDARDQNGRIIWNSQKQQLYRDLVKMELGSMYGIENYDEHVEVYGIANKGTTEIEGFEVAKEVKALTASILTPKERLDLLGSKFIDENGKLRNRGVILGRDNYEKEIKYRQKMHRLYPDKGFDKPLMPGDKMLFVKIPSDDYTNTLMPLYFAGVTEQEGVVITESGIIKFTGGDFDGDGITKFMVDENLTFEQYEEVFDHLLSLQPEIQNGKNLANDLKKMCYTKIGNERMINRYLGVPFKDDNNSPQFAGLGRRLAGHQVGQDQGIVVINNIARAFQQINNDISAGKASDVITKNELIDMLPEGFEFGNIPGFESLQGIKMNIDIETVKSAIFSFLKQTYVDTYEMVPLDRYQGVIAGLVNDFELVYDESRNVNQDGFPERLSLFHLGGEFNPTMEKPADFDKLTMMNPNYKGQELKLMLGEAILKHMFSIAGINYKSLDKVENPHEMIDKVMETTKVENPGNTYTRTLEAVRDILRDETVKKPELPPIDVPLETDVFMERTTPQAEQPKPIEPVEEVTKPEQEMTETQPQEPEAIAKVGEEPAKPEFVPTAGKMLESLKVPMGAQYGILQGLKKRYQRASKLIWGNTMSGEVYDQIRNSDLTNNGMYNEDDVVGMYPDFLSEPDWIEIDKAIAGNVKGFILKTENKKHNSKETLPLYTAMQIADYLQENGYTRWTNKKGELTDNYVRKDILKPSTETFTQEVASDMPEQIKTRQEASTEVKSAIPSLKDIKIDTSKAKGAGAIAKAVADMKSPVGVINGGSYIKTKVNSEGVYEDDANLMAQIREKYPDAIVVKEAMEPTEIDKLRDRTFVVFNKTGNKANVNYLAKNKYDYVIAGYEDVGFSLGGESYPSSNGLEIASTILRSEIANEVQSLVGTKLRDILNKQIVNGTMAKYSFDDFYESKIKNKKGYSVRGPIELVQGLISNIMYGGKPTASENALSPFEIKTEDGKIKNKDFLKTLTEFKDTEGHYLFAQDRYIPFKIAAGTVLKHMIDNNVPRLGDYVLRSSNDIATLLYSDGVISDNQGNSTTLENVFAENGELQAAWIPAEFLQSPDFRDLITFNKGIDARELELLKSKVLVNITDSMHSILSNFGVNIDKGLLYTANAFYEVQRDKAFREKNLYKGSLANMRGTHMADPKWNYAYETGQWLTKTHLGGKTSEDIMREHGSKFLNEHSDTNIWQLIKSARDAGIIPKVANDVTLEDFMIDKLNKKGESIGLEMSASSIEDVSWKDKSVKDFFRTIREHAAKSSNQKILDAVNKPMSEWDNETMMAISREIIKPYLEKVLPPLALGTGKGTIEEAQSWSDYTIQKLMAGFMPGNSGYMNKLEAMYDKISGENSHSRTIARNFMNQNYLASIAELILELRKTKSGTWWSNIKIWGSKLPTEMLKRHSMNKQVFNATDEIMDIPEVVNGEAGQVDTIRLKDEADWELGVQLPYVLLPKQYPMILAATRLTKLKNNLAAETNRIKEDFESIENNTDTEIASGIESLDNVIIAKNKGFDEYTQSDVVDPGNLLDEIKFQTKTKNGVVQDGKVTFNIRKPENKVESIIFDVQNDADLRDGINTFLNSWNANVDPTIKTKLFNYIKYKTALENYRNMLVSYTKAIESFANRYKNGRIDGTGINAKDNLQRLNSFIAKMGKLNPTEVAMMTRDIRDDVDMSDAVQYFQDNFITPNEESFIEQRNIQFEFNSKLREKYKNYSRVKKGRTGQGDFMGSIRTEIKKLLAGETKQNATAGEAIVSENDRYEIDRQIKAGTGSTYVLSRWGEQIASIISENINGTGLIVGKDANGKAVTKALTSAEQKQLFNEVLSDVRNLIDEFYKGDNAYYDLFRKLGIKGYDQALHYIKTAKEWDAVLNARREISKAVKNQMHKLAKDAQVNYFNQFVASKDVTEDIRAHYNFTELFQKVFADKTDAEGRVVDKFFTTRLDKASNDIDWVMTNSLIDLNNTMLHNYLEFDRETSKIADMNTISVLTNTIGMPYKYGQELPIGQFNDEFKATELTEPGSYYIPSDLKVGDIVTMRLKDNKTFTARLLCGVKCKENVLNKDTKKAEVRDVPYYVFSNDINNSPNQSFIAADMIATMRKGESPDWTLNAVQGRMRHHIQNSISDMAEEFKHYITQRVNDKGRTDNIAQRRASNKTIHYIQDFNNDKSVAKFVRWGQKVADAGQVGLYYLRARHILTGLSGVAFSGSLGGAVYYGGKGITKYLMGIGKLFLQNRMGYTDNLVYHPVVKRNQRAITAQLMRGLSGVKNIWSGAEKEASATIARQHMSELVALESTSEMGHLNEQMGEVIDRIMQNNEEGHKYFKNKLLKTRAVNKLAKGIKEITQEMTEDTEIAEQMREGEEHVSRVVRKVADKIEWLKVTMKEAEFDNGEYVMKNKSVHVPKIKGLSDHDSLTVITLWDQLLYLASLRGGILTSEKTSAGAAVRKFYEEKVKTFSDEYGGHISNSFTSNLLEREASMGYGNYKRNMAQKTWLIRNLNRFSPFGYEKGQNITKYNMSRQDMYKAYKESNGAEFDRFIGDMAQLGIPIGEWFLEQSNSLPKAFAVRSVQLAIKTLIKYGAMGILGTAGKAINTIFSDPSEDIDEILSLQGFAFGPLEMSMQMIATIINALLVSESIGDLTEAKKATIASDMLKMPGQSLRGVMGKGATDALNALTVTLYAAWKGMTGEELAGIVDKTKKIEKNNLKTATDLVNWMAPGVGTITNEYINQSWRK